MNQSETHSRSYWPRVVLDLLIGPYFIGGVLLINKHFFSGEISGLALSLLMTILAIVGYPIWGWKRNSPWRFVGRWSFAKWAVAGVGVGILTMLLQVFLRSVVQH